ncbi:MAG: magnesium transporter [Bacilli bacterium]|jgi:magnesium transporter|nr:magnesium transporter [Bacilli bacterium]
MDEEEKDPRHLGESPEDENEGKTEQSEEVRVKTISTDHLAEVIQRKDSAELKRIFDEVPDIDIAEAADGLEIKDLINFFRDVSSSTTAELFEELSQDKKEELVKGLTDKDLVKVINEQAADDLADAVGDMPANLAKRVLHAADKDMRADINQILKYKPDTAGAIMTTEYLEFRQSESVGDTIEAVRTIGREAETVYTIFVRNDKRKFVGTVDLDDLIFAKKDESLGDIMNHDAPSVHVQTDKEEVANVISRYDLNAVAVLNDDECLTGIVTVDDALDVMTAEANEDIEKMNAVSPIEDEFLETHPWKMAKKCLPWICVLLFLDTFSTMVVDKLQYQFEVYKILIAFIPVIMDTAGNAGGQTISLIIRGLATKEFEPKDFWKVIGREAQSALLIAAGAAGFGFVWFTVEQYLGLVSNTAILDADGLVMNVWNGNCWNLTYFSATMRVSLSVAITLFVAIFLSKIVAVSLPIGAAAVKKDPAIVSQPLLTTVVDVSSLLIYLGIAALIILQFLPAA